MHGLEVEVLGIRAQPSRHEERSPLLQSIDLPLHEYGRIGAELFSDDTQSAAGRPRASPFVQWLTPPIVFAAEMIADLLALRLEKCPARAFGPPKSILSIRFGALRANE